MKAFNPVLAIKKYKIWIILISLLAGMAGFVFLNGQQSYSATAIIEYTNDEASQGEAPDGSVIDPSEIYSTEVLKEVFQRMGMDYDDYNLDKFRSKVVVSEVLTDEEEAVRTALNEQGEEMTTVPTKYRVSLTLDKKDAANPKVFVRELLENMVDVYLRLYGENHVSGSVIGNEILKLDEADIDYIEFVETIDTAVGETIDSIYNIIRKEDGFRSVLSGYSFDDLYREFLLIENRDIPNLYAYVLNNRITKDADVLIAKYQQRIEDANIENESSLRKIQDIKQVITAYVEMMRQSGNTDITFEYILDEVYDPYFRDVTTGDTNSEPAWVNPDETIEYEVLLEAYIDNRTDYEYALIEMAFCQYVIENYGGEAIMPIPPQVQPETPDALDGAETGTVDNTAPQPQEEPQQLTGEPLVPQIGITGDTAGAEAGIQALTDKLDDLYGKLSVVKSEYNEFCGAENVALITNIVVSENVNVLLYSVLLMVLFMLAVSALVIFVDRMSDIMNYYIYVDRKFLVGNRSACDQFLSKYEGHVLDRGTVCICLNLTNLRGKNARYGREACDEMMLKLVDIMKRIFPDEPACNIMLNGQGQFVLFLENTSEAQARAYLKYLTNEAESYNTTAACPIEFHCGVAEAEKEDTYQLRALLVLAVNKANSAEAIAF